MSEREMYFQEGYIHNLQCRNCIFKCKDCNYSETCLDFMSKIDESERKKILHQIRYQNVNIGKFSKKHNLKIKYLKKMIMGKIPYSYKAYTLLMNRLEESEEWIREEKRFDRENDKYEELRKAVFEQLG